MAKRTRHLSDDEKIRRADQAMHAPVRRKDNREQRRERERDGVTILHDPATTFKLKYDISVPGGPTREVNPAQYSGMLVAENEGDLMRGIVVKLIEAYGFTRLVRAVSGCLAEVINPIPMAMRHMLMLQIAQGTGLELYVQEVTSCLDCGAPSDIVEIIDPHKPDDQQMEKDDQTEHKPGCPTIPDADGKSKPVEWKSGPALFIDHPAKYEPVYTAPPPTVVEPVPDGESIPVTDDPESNEVEEAQQRDD